MTRLYKLTDENCQTYDGMTWEIGKINQAIGPGNELCTSDVLHAYSDPLVAIFLNPIHANFKNPRLFLAEGDVVADDRLKVGCKSMVTIAELDVPRPTIETRVTFGILCAMEVCHDKKWCKWAENWLNGSYRTAFAYTYADADAATYAAAAAAANAAAKKINIDLARLADQAFRLDWLV